LDQLIGGLVFENMINLPIKNQHFQIKVHLYGIALIIPKLFLVTGSQKAGR